MNHIPPGPARIALCSFAYDCSLCPRGEAEAIALRRRAVEFVMSKQDSLKLTMGEDFIEGYEAMMMDESAWGGGVEIDVFSQLYKCTIHVFNVAQMEEEIFGRGRGSRFVCF